MQGRVPRGRTLRAIVALSLASVVFAACGGSDTGPKGRRSPTDTGSPEPASGVIVKTFNFTPAEHTVSAGTALTWINRDDITHTVTSGTPGTKSGLFDSKLEGPGSTFTFRFASAGTFSYFCNNHQSMIGKVVVT